MPFEEVLTALVMVAVLDPTTPEVRSAVQRARDFLTAQRAQPFLDQLEAGFTRAGSNSQAEASPALGAPTRT
jgi:hypothetical protein